jgi:hypothetical protein
MNIAGSFNGSGLIPPLGTNLIPSTMTIEIVVTITVTITSIVIAVVSATMVIPISPVSS